MFREGLDIVGVGRGTPVHTSGVGTVILNPGRLGWCLSAAAWWKRWEQVAVWIQWSLFASDARLLLHEMIEKILETASFWWQLHEFFWCLFFRHMTDHVQSMQDPSGNRNSLRCKQKPLAASFSIPKTRPAHGAVECGCGAAEWAKCSNFRGSGSHHPRAAAKCTATTGGEAAGLVFGAQTVRALEHFKGSGPAGKWPGGYLAFWSFRFFSTGVFTGVLVDEALGKLVVVGDLLLQSLNSPFQFWISWQQFNS